MKKIYIEPTWRMHSLVKGLLSYPPEGYEFIIPNNVEGKVVNPLAKIGLAHSIYHLICRIIPVSLLKPYLERYKKIPDGIDLTYSIAHLVFRKEPWILDLDSEPVFILAGHAKLLKRYKRFIEKTLASMYCRKILCQIEAVKKSLLSNLDCRDFENKIEVVPYVVPPKEFIKTFNKDKVKLLFVNSANVPGSFEIKGGCEVLEAFVKLRQKYNNVEMVVRSDIPEAIKSKYINTPGLRIIDKIIPWEMLEHEFKTADIFFSPAHITPALAFLDAMSYELPIVTIDVWGNSEMVKDGKTGLLVKKSGSDPYYMHNGMPAWGETGISKKLRNPDPNVVNELVSKTSLLIENTELRQKMGKAGRAEIEHGRFSIKSRNEKLKRIFDEAVSR